MCHLIAMQPNGNNERNDINLSTFASTLTTVVAGKSVTTRTSDSNLTVGTVQTLGKGDVNLSVQGTIKRSAEGSAAVLADVLTLSSDAVLVAGARAVELNTQVATLRLQTQRLGDVLIKQGNANLVVDESRVVNGRFDLTAGANVTLASLDLPTNDQRSQVSVNAAGGTGRVRLSSVCT